MRTLIVAGNRTVASEVGVIVEAEGRFDLVLELPDTEVRPGLINAHEHLHRNHYGRLGRPPYGHARDWAFDIQAADGERIAAGRLKRRRDALLQGAWKNLAAGVTTVVHQDAWEADFEHDFPLRVVRLPSADSLAMTPELERLAGRGAYALHLAEGVDRQAAEEVRTLDSLGLLAPGLIAAHGVGMDRDGIARFASSGAALAWCPSSNLFLFGRTAPQELLDQAAEVLLGSDSRLTGAGDLLDELRCARAHGGLDDRRLEQAVGAAAARRLGLAPPSLEPGAPADLVVLCAPLLQAQAQDVLLVMAGGRLRLAHPELAPRLGRAVPGGGLMNIGSVVRWTDRGTGLAPDGRPYQ
jgi:cytosine/adenosine deaminase-related metal-dependent hydrolase